MDRRTFLKVSALTTTAAAAASSTFASAKLSAASAKISTSAVAPDAGGHAADNEAYWLSIREQFPIVKELIYMNNGTMGPSPRLVTDRVTDRIRHVDSTGDYGGNYEKIRGDIGGLIGATADEIAFTHNTSESISIIASGLDLKSGDEVIMTDQEHAGNAVPWLARKKRDGIEIRFVTLAPTDEEVMQRFADAITPRTRVIAVPHITCTTGQLLPMKRLAALARSKNIWLIADGAHPPGMLTVNVKELGVHAYASCGHKWLCGPKGIGFLYASPEILDHVLPTWAGAESDQYWGYDGRIDFLPTASRYDFATQNFALYDGLQTAIGFQQEIGTKNIEDRVIYLTKRLRSGLHDIAGNKFHFLTPETSLTGITTIKLRDQDYHEFSNTLLAKHKVRTRVVPESKLDANRFSVHIYTSTADVDAFLSGVKDVLT